MPVPCRAATTALCGETVACAGSRASVSTIRNVPAPVPRQGRPGTRRGRSPTSACGSWSWTRTGGRGRRWPARRARCARRSRPPAPAARAGAGADQRRAPATRRRPAGTTRRGGLRRGAASTGPATIARDASSSRLDAGRARWRRPPRRRRRSVDAQAPSAIAGSSAAGAASRRSGRPSVARANTTAPPACAAAAARDEVANAVNAPSEASARPATCGARRPGRGRRWSPTAPSIARLLALPSVPCRRPVSPNDSAANERADDRPDALRAGQAADHDEHGAHRLRPRGGDAPRRPAPPARRPPPGARPAATPAATATSSSDASASSA